LHSRQIVKASSQDLSISVSNTLPTSLLFLPNEGQSAASFCHLDMFCNLYLVKNRKIANNSTTTKASEKISTDLETLEFFDVCWIEFKNNQILLNKIFIV
jgi:hypothetical protein